MEDKEDNQNHNHHHPSLLPNHNTITANTNNNSTDPPLKEESQIRKSNNNIGCGSDRLKRDEWSEGAVSTLLEAYESKWVLRNRAKLKGQDWEDVARYVSSRANSTKSPKTQTQCKNKIESMKKRYRSESASADASSWPLYSRLDILLRGSRPVSSPVPPQPPQPPQTAAVVAVAAPSSNNNSNQALMVLEPSLAASQAPHRQTPPPAAVTPPLATAQNSNGSNGVERIIAKDDGLGTKLSDHVSNKNSLDTDSSTPALYSERDKLRCKKRKNKMEMTNKRLRKYQDMEISESIRWLAEVVVKSEETRMDTMKEIERMRVEAEAKRAEMDLKRTEIIANTQLEIARIFASINNKDVDSSLRIGKS